MFCRKSKAIEKGLFKGHKNLSYSKLIAEVSIVKYLRGWKYFARQIGGLQKKYPGPVPSLNNVRPPSAY